MDFLLSLVQGDFVFTWLGEVFQSEVAKMTIAFMVAARLHRQWVKKDMAEFRDAITKSLDHVADALSRRMDEFDRRLSQVEEFSDDE